MDFQISKSFEQNWIFFCYDRYRPVTLVTTWRDFVFYTNFDGAVIKELIYKIYNTIHETSLNFDEN